VPGLINGGSAHSRAGSETTEDQRSKQVTVASYTTPLEYYDGVYSMPYIDFQSPANQVAKDENQDNNGSEIIILSKRIADYIFGREECAFVGQESELDQAEPEALCCDGGATSSLSSSFLNCTEITERAVPIHTAQGGTVMTTTHVCLKTYYARDRTGELRPITTKTYIVKDLKHDLLSGKMLNKAGYRIILDEDPEESGIFAVNEGKICKIANQNHFLSSAA
jgi:hypothetical protein